MNNFRNNLYYSYTEYDQELNEDFMSNIKSMITRNQGYNRIDNHNNKVNTGRKIVDKNLGGVAAGVERYGARNILGNKIGSAMDTDNYMKKYGQVRKLMYGKAGHKLYEEVYDFRNNLFYSIIEGNSPEEMYNRAAALHGIRSTNHPSQTGINTYHDYYNKKARIPQNQGRHDIEARFGIKGGIPLPNTGSSSARRHFNSLANIFNKGSRNTPIQTGSNSFTYK